MAVRTSIRSLVASSGVPLSALVRGAHSLGAMFETRGFSAVPSPSQPHPGADPYFSGGYNTARHGSRDGGPISGVQLEAHFTGVRDTPASRASFAAALVSILDAYFARYYGAPLLPAQ